ncbi:beta-1,3-galactosyl-O-glycosyl-glycoprotein beta-1,6-N-acetylglucosaminyltransferase 3-like isoform X2 [Takifugu flavidus]|uniref:beta-1,3-galactosyl-O-glycosyl-glycoprotein beta-1,6-N-acetylglucosaminyltransferase 3-like isoform X2 n=1 Tax=Takifugu flavidus TaxID=433684 RepID=UPI00254415C0|nr:beta-1,3-galactosyl-O-glycosyl-glycoprotein beta-1,6-N-acetylglucosaminyltransferase 3-like isoform X2 [Takifugu flavidus]
MWLLKYIKLKLMLKLTVVVASLGILVVLRHTTSWRTTHMFSYSWLEITDDDVNMDAVCNCSAILLRDQEEIEKVKILAIRRDFQKTIQVPDEYYVNATQDCRNFKIMRKYLQYPLSKEEEEFPLAYSMVVHHKVQNFERLLRAIYAPQNIYCVHVDKKSKPSYQSAVRAIVSCFPNVFIVSRPVDVVYASWSRVQADINCMADLYNSSTKWKYFLNVCGQDFPLKTNWEMVQLLRYLKGENSMESEKMPEGKKWRVTKVHEGTGRIKEPPPFDLPILSGNAYIVVSRGYIRSVLEDKRVQVLIEWAKDTYSPDEFLWATIQRMPGVPGSRRPHAKFDMTDLNAIARLVKWAGHEGVDNSRDAVYPRCEGRHVRGICVYGVGDLWWVLEHRHLFANKFDTEIDPFAIYCLEKYLRRKALAEIH